jgi:isoamyl acetate esterase
MAKLHPQFHSMKRSLFLLFFLPFLLAYDYQKKTKVVFFGDSITELGARPGGYILKIDSLCKGDKKEGHFEFVGAGIGGNKIYDLFLRMDTDVLAKNPDIVVIFVGINDVWHKQLTGTGTDQDRFERFMNAILKKLKDRDIRAVLCTPTVIGERKDMSNQMDGDLNRYSHLIRGIAAKQQVPLVDLRKAFMDYLEKNNPTNEERNILTYDRVHMNTRGNLLIAEQIWAVLKNR